MEVFKKLVKQLLNRRQIQKVCVFVLIFLSKSRKAKKSRSRTVNYSSACLGRCEEL